MESSSDQQEVTSLDADETTTSITSPSTTAAAASALESNEPEEVTRSNPTPTDQEIKAAAAQASYASRQTVAELEAKAEGKSLSRASSSSDSTTATIQTRPGAVAMYRSDSNPTTCSVETNAGEIEEVPMIHAQLADDPHPPLVIQAHLAEDPPVAVSIPEAELVTPPQHHHHQQHHPEALHVQFDEEAPPHRPIPRDNHGGGGGGGGFEPPTKLKKFWSQHGKPLLRFNILLLVIGLIVGIVVPRIHQDKETQAMEDKLKTLEDFFGEDFQLAFEGPTGAPTPAPSVRTVFPCYDSTLKVAQAQTQDPLRQMFVLCPNLVIPLGTLTDDRKIEGGDYPLSVIGDNVEIRCGLDGRRDNHCVLEGGFLQVLLRSSLPDDLAGATVNRTDHVIFRGITFTGNLVQDSQGLIGGMSILAYNPGQAISFIDCAWENMTAPRGLVQIGDSRDLPFAPTTDVSFEDCSFSKIQYSGGPLIGVYGQSLTVRQTRFEDIRLPSSIEPCPIHDTLEWCQGLLYCFGRSVCELEDICVDGLDYAGPAAVAVASRGTNLSVYGEKFSEDLNLHASLVSTASNPTCSTGMAHFTDPNNQSPECIQESSNWTESGFCGV